MSNEAALRAIGPFPAVQVVPAFSGNELLSNPVQHGAASGHLTYHGGPTIKQPQVLNCYLDDAFAGDQEADFDAFTQALVEDGYLGGVMANYGTAPGKYLGSVRMASGMSGTVTDAQLAAFVDAHFSQYKGSETYVGLIMPASLQVSMDGASSCSSFCGYHTQSPGGVYYGVICDSTCPGCHGGFSPHDANMMVRSHELGEWATDPQGTGWYDDSTGSENADICAWQRVTWGPAGGDWCVQPLWTNEQGCYVAPYVAPSGGGTPQPVPQPQHYRAPAATAPVFAAAAADSTFAAALAELMNDMIRASAVARQEAGTLYTWLEANPTRMQDALDAGWGKWFETNKLDT